MSFLLGPISGALVAGGVSGIYLGLSKPADRRVWPEGILWILEHDPDEVSASATSC